MITGLRMWREDEGWGSRKTYRRRSGNEGSAETQGASFLGALGRLVAPDAWYVWRYRRTVGNEEKNMDP